MITIWDAKTRCLLPFKAGVETGVFVCLLRGCSATLKIIENVEPQPLLAHAIRVSQALQFLGSSLEKEDVAKPTALQKNGPEVHPC